MNIDLRKKTKNNYGKGFFKLMNNVVLEKLWKMWERRDIKLATTGRRRNYLVSEPNHHTTIFFRENLLAIEIQKSHKPVCLGLSILELSKMLMYEFWYDCIKLKYGEETKLYSLHA